MSAILTSLRKTLLNIILGLLPLLMLVAVLYLPDQWFGETERGQVIGKAIATIIFATIQIIVLKRFLLPPLGQFVTSIFLTDFDPVETNFKEERVRALLQEGSYDTALDLLEHFTRTHPKLLRSWILRTDVLVHDMQRYNDAIAVLQDAMRTVRWNRQDRAFFLYRIGKIYADHLDDPGRAGEYWTRAATKYPTTAYGRESAKRLDEMS